MAGYTGFRGVVRARVEELDRRFGNIAISVQQIRSKFPANTAQQSWLLKKQRILVQDVSEAMPRELSTGDRIDIAVIHVAENNFRFAGETLRKIETVEHEEKQTND